MAKARGASLVTIPGMTGRLCLSACPGTWTGPADAATVARDLAAIAATGARLLVTLVEAHELPLPLADWRDAVRAAGLEPLHLPIPDWGVPEAAFETAWSEARLAERLAAGETLALHCRAGLGRTGTVAARLLIEAAGMDAAAAIARVRRNHAAEAVETDGQVAHLHAVAARNTPPA